MCPDEKGDVIKMLKRTFDSKSLGAEILGHNSQVIPYRKDYDKGMLTLYDKTLQEKYLSVRRMLDTIEKELSSERNKLKEYETTEGIEVRRQSDHNTNWIHNLDERLIYLQLSQNLDSWKHNYSILGDTIVRNNDGELGELAQALKHNAVRYAEYLDEIEKSIYEKTQFNWKKATDPTALFDLFNREFEEVES